MENQIFQDLKGLHLSGMAECWQNLQETRKHQEIVLQDGLAMLIQAEHDQRAANKTARLIKNARFRYDASIEQVLFDPAKGRDQGRIMQLAVTGINKYSEIGNVSAVKMESVIQ